MKKIMFAVLAVMMVLPGIMFAEGQKEAAESKPVSLKLSHSYETTTAFHEGAIWAAEQIKERTDGRYSIEVFPSGALGTEREVEEALSIGTVDIGFVGPGHMAQTYAPISIHLAAFLWRDIDHFLKYPESNTYKEVTGEYEQRSGNHILALTYFGQRHVTSNVPLHTPKDFEGLKMRVPPVPIYMMFPEAVGANSTPINFNELYLALQQGVVVAQENPLTTIKAKKFYEVQKYIILTGHMTDGFYTLIGDHVMSRLSDEDARIFREVFEEAAIQTTQAIIEQENSLAKWFEEQGVEVIEVDRQLFMDACADSMTGDDLPWTQAQIDELKNL